MQRFRKDVIARMAMPYPLGTVQAAGETCVVAAPEAEGPLVLSRPPYTGAAEIAPGPGGCMALVSAGMAGSDLFAIMGCFVGYKFQTGGILRFTPEDHGPPTAPWHSQRIAELPFAHRMELVWRGGERWLVAATLAADKKDAADWSKPGTVYACPVPSGPGGWKLQPILENVHRNHGFLVAQVGGHRLLLIAGQEGVFASDLDAGGRPWAFEKVMPQEVSEMAVADLDGDGAEEMATIEPFHGNTLRVYRREGGRWVACWEAAIDFGHCLIAAEVGGAPSLLVSNRAGSKDLLLFPWAARMGAARACPEPERIVIDRGAAAANMLVLRHNGEDLIFATNQAAGEVVRYTLLPE